MSSTGEILMGPDAGDESDAVGAESRVDDVPGQRSGELVVESALLDRNGVIVAVNQAWTAFCDANGGDRARTGVGVSYLDVCEAAAGDPLVRHVAGAIRAAVRGDLPAPVRVRIPCHAPQVRRWFDILIASRLDGWGVCIGATLTVTPAPAPPVTEPAELDRSSPWRAFDLVPDPVFVLDERIRVDYVNPAAMQLLGYSEEEFVGLRLADLDLQVDPAAARADLEQLTGPGSIQVMTCDMSHRNGTQVPVEAHIRSTTDGLGTRRYVVVTRDLRPSRHQDALLRAGEESFQVAFERAPVGMAVVRLGGSGRHDILRANHALADFLGVPVGELIGNDLSAFGTLADVEVHDQIVVDVLAAGRSSHGRKRRFRRTDGSYRWAEVRVSQVDFPGVQDFTVLAHLLDVTEQHEAETRRALEAAMASAVAEITRSVLAATPLPKVYELIADSTATVFGAETVAVGLPDPVTGLLRPVAAVGPASSLLLTGQVQLSQELAQRLLRIRSLTTPPSVPELPREILDTFGPTAVARFGGPDPSGGLITAARPRGAEPFSEIEVTALTTLAQQVALAVELGNARLAEQRLAVLEDRQRIARDLHDTVIQDLIAVGMQLDAGLPRETDPVRRSRDGALIDHLEEAVRRLRGSVFELREPATSYRSVGNAVQAVAVEVTRVLGHRPSVRIMGPVDVVPPVIHDAIVAVTREALSNVARHARATSTEVTLTIEADRVRLLVEDDGRGLPARMVPGDGIANIRQRAVGLRGTAVVETRQAVRDRASGLTRLGRGTRVVWTCPLPSGAPAEGGRPREAR